MERQLVTKPGMPEAKTNDFQPSSLSCEPHFSKNILHSGKLLGNPRGLCPVKLQAKLRIGQPNDVFEQEADRVAEQIMRMPDPAIQRKCAKCDEDEKEVLQAKELPGQALTDQERDVSPIVHDVLRSPGQPLDPATRSFMEPRFGYDFSKVRVHTDSKAAKTSGALMAQAFTLGHNIVFGADRYQPETAEGKRLLAHELTHVVQQQSVSQSFPKKSKLFAGDSYGKDRNELFNLDQFSVGNKSGYPLVKTVAGENTIQCAFPIAIAAAVVALAAAGYAWWAHSCLAPVEIPMYIATFGPDYASNRTGGFRRWYFDQTGNPVPSRAWDAFGHCFVACAATKRCGSTTAAIAGQGRELYREYIDAAPHDSYTQDTNNQSLGRGFGRQGVDCEEACRNASLQSGTMDLTAPLVNYWTPTRGEYPASAEERRQDTERLREERRQREAQQLQETLRRNYQVCMRESLERPGGVPTREEELEAQERCRQRTGYPH